jgi:phage gp36-like protein
MGSYTTEAKIWSLMPQLPLTSSAGYTAASALVAQAITDAEAEIDGYVANRYSLPFSSVPVQVSAIADSLACYYTYLYVYSADNMNRNAFSEGQSTRYEIQLNKLKAIADGEVVLTVSGGGVVEQASSSSMVISANQSYTPIFDVDTSTSWGIDSDRSDAITNDRG